MAERVQIQSLTPRHEAIMVFLIANPMMKRGDVARTFGVTQTWLSTLLNSDAFRARYDELQKEHTSVCVIEVKEKLETLAHITLDRLIEQVEMTTDIREVRETARLALDRIGFSGGPPANGLPAFFQQNNFLGSVDAQTLREARSRIVSRGEPPIEALPSPSNASEVPSRGGSDEGDSLSDPSPVHSTSSTERKAG